MGELTWRILTWVVKKGFAAFRAPLPGGPEWSLSGFSGNSVSTQELVFLTELAARAENRQ
jgi:hypothetical protein